MPEAKAPRLEPLAAKAETVSLPLLATKSVWAGAEPAAQTNSRASPAMRADTKGIGFKKLMGENVLQAEQPRCQPKACQQRKPNCPGRQKIPQDFRPAAAKNSRLAL